MIRNLLAVSFAALSMGGAAVAADMPSYPAEPVAVVAPEAGYDWTGFYVGIHGGYALDGTADFDGPVAVGGLEGFVIGGQAGYNWSWNSLLLGLEADASYSDQEGDAGVFSSEVNYLASIRGRVGFTFDRFLAYGTGGAAFAGADFDFNGVASASDDADFFGWAAGGGVEYAITDNVSFGVEYLHYEFDDEDVFAVSTTDLDSDVVRGRVNVKFDSLFGR